jgi:predicted nucleic acid-binding protein
MIAVFDSNVIIDYLNGVEAAKKELEIFEKKAISVITYIEVFSKIYAGKEITEVKAFIRDNLEIIQITNDIAEKAIEIRKSTKLKSPDAIILATAMVNNAFLVTRDKNFDREMPTIRIPY